MKTITETVRPKYLIKFSFFLLKKRRSIAPKTGINKSIVSIVFDSIKL